MHILNHFFNSFSKIYSRLFNSSYKMSKMSTSNWMDEKSKLILALKEQADPKDVTICVKRLIQNGYTANDIMTDAIFENRIEFVDSVIKIDPTIITYTNRVGMTYLHEAVSGSYVISNIIQLMIKSGFDVNARADHGTTPLIDAIFSEHSSIVTLLVENGANIDGRGVNGNTALMIAAYDRFEQIPNLIKLGASVNIRNDDGFSAIENTLARKTISAMKLIAFFT